MYPRDLVPLLLELVQEYAVITVVGPRQSGKTTLVRSLFSEKPYVDLDEPDVREIALTDPRKFLGQYPDGAVLDEVQRAPELLSYIRHIVDEKKEKGMFILTGSHQLQLHEAVTQSLAGRTALLSLYPMSLAELCDAGIALTADQYLLSGGYPAIHADRMNPTRAYRNYIATYVEQDLRQLLQVKDLAQFQLFMKICAGRTGQLINREAIAGEVGIASNTVRHWLSILEASYIIYPLRPYFENFGKRLVKAPKLYFTDVGLAAYLLGITTTQELSRDRMRGALFENLVVMELVKARANEGLDPNLYYFRDTHGHEVDIIYQYGQELIPIEVKSGATFQKEFLKHLHFFQKLAGERAPKGYLVYSGEQEQEIGANELVNYRHAARIVRG